MIDSIYRNAAATEGDMQCNEDEQTDNLGAGSELTAEPADQPDDLTRSFIRLSNLPTYPSIG
jgi:hypothetical protein